MKYLCSSPLKGKIFFFWNIRVLPRQQGLPTACATSKGDGGWGRGGQGGQGQGALDDDADDGHLVGDDYWGGQGGQSQGDHDDDADEDADLLSTVGGEDDLSEAEATREALAKVIKIIMNTVVIKTIDHDHDNEAKKWWSWYDGGQSEQDDGQGGQNQGDHDHDQHGGDQNNRHGGDEIVILGVGGHFFKAWPLDWRICIHPPEILKHLWN